MIDRHIVLLYFVVMALAIVAFLWLSDDAMSICTVDHSYDTCRMALR